MRRVILGKKNPAVPTTQARYLAFSNTTNNSIKIGWIRGSGTGRILVMYNVSLFGAANWSDVYNALSDIHYGYEDVNGNVLDSSLMGINDTNLINYKVII